MFGLVIVVIEVRGEELRLLIVHHIIRHSSEVQWAVLGARPYAVGSEGFEPNRDLYSN